MNFGIPFRKPFGAPFGVPFLGGVTGPVFPTAGNVGYYSAEDISNLGFSSANSVNFVADQATVTYGGEEITNGDFSQGSTGWSVIGGADFEDGYVTLNTLVATRNSGITQSITLTDNKCLITFDVLAIRGTSTSVRIIEFNPTQGTTSTDINVSVGKNTFITNYPTDKVQIRAISTVDVDIDITNISAKEILTGTNDLTQGTASANPLFIEHDTVTQFTLANQPTLKYDKEVSQDTSANQPTLVDVGGGELAMGFDGDYMSEFLSTISSEFTILLKLSISSIASDKPILADEFDNRTLGLQTSNAVRVRKTDSSISDYTGSTISVGDHDIILRNSTANGLEVWNNGIKLNGSSSYGEEYDFSRLGRGASSDFLLREAKYYNTAVSDPTNIVETPDFELLPDPTTMRKDDGTQPIAGDQIQGWHATGAELAMEFDGDYLKKNSSLPSNFTIRVDLTYTGNAFPISRASANEIFLYGTQDRFRIHSTDNTTYTFANLNNKEKESVVIHKNGNTLSLVVDGALEGNTYDVSGKSFEFGYIGSSFTAVSPTSIKKIQQWDSAVSDPTNITETPDFELIPSEDSCNVLAGQQVSRWNATSHKPWLNRLLSDGNDDHLEGMAVQTGDFTYMFKLAFNALSTTEYIFSHTTGLSAVVLLSDNYIYLRDTTGANDIGLIGHTVELGEHVYTITREGDSLKYYVDSCLKETVDVTGRTFELDTFGRPTDSLADLTADWGVWNRALTKEELDYFSYLRSEDTNEILLPPLTPTCP